MTISISEDFNRAIDEGFKKLLNLVGINQNETSRFKLTDGLNRTKSVPSTLYVATNGSDDNIGTEAQPFRTIQAAIDSLSGLELKSKVTIQVGVGSFSAFTLDMNKILVSPTADTATGNHGIEIIGTMVPATLTSGTDTGTASSAVVNLAAVLTDVTQNWTVNELRGKMLSLASFPDLLFPIISNTATTLEYATNAGSSSTVYSILDFATNIDSGAKYLYGSTNASAAGRVFLIGQPSLQATANCVVRRLNVLSELGNISSRTVTMVDASIFQESRAYKSSGGASGQGIVQMNGSRSVVQRCVIHSDSGALAIGLSSLGGTGCSITQNLIFSSSGSARGLWAANTSSPFTVTTGNNTFIGFSTAFGATSPTVANFSTGGRFINCTVGIQTGDGTVLPHTAINGLFYFENCGTCIAANGPTQINIHSACTGTGNTNGIVLTTGARCKIFSTATLGAVTELSVDGVTGTLATLRGNSPKVFPLVPNPYGTYVYE